ncbi:hypothetical protein [Pseudoteredinibacter isoporae]|uniref:Uncharacterized protein n=1 Tax=Pseudoteredinibacter isoporae TaxID=570281 RepID=A0A7X0JQC8_9GAMM|nr:hypothetical protein [Pseudoteredinibacter isoporae]MBB6520252.1 hypothetical protein [Pseudoteredinibacter isoporae]NHO85824.1 hypothetical protein [Pseudoteredinibacter isoporae]NIB25724.1 hypothetical protein [Pseudoteredinibacter isoporae]
MRILNVLDKDDFPFFTAFGFLLSYAMWFFDELSLPAHMERGYLSELLFDHIPYSSISTLLICMTLIELASVAISPKQGLLVKQNIHISKRISQFSSPAFFIVMGFSIPVIIESIRMKNPLYFSQFLMFLTFALSVGLLLFLSRQIVLKSKCLHEKMSRVWARTSFALLVVILVGIIGLNGEPKVVELKLDLGTYELAAEAAEKRNMSINQYIDFAVSSQLNEYNASKN